MCTGVYITNVHCWTSTHWVRDCRIDIWTFRVGSSGVWIHGKKLVDDRRIIIQTTALRNRSTFAGIGGATEAAACLCAPLIGGFLTDRLSWRWCFYIELPLIVAASILILAFLCTPQKQNTAQLSAVAKLRALDPLGTALVIASLTLLIIALQWGGSKYPWASWRILIALAMSLVLLAAFAYLQHRRRDTALVPPRIFLQHSVLAGFLFSSCNNGSLSVIEYYVRLTFTSYVQLEIEAHFLAATLLPPDDYALLTFPRWPTPSPDSWWPHTVRIECRIPHFAHRMLQTLYDIDRLDYADGGGTNDNTW